VREHPEALPTGEEPYGQGKCTDLSMEVPVEEELLSACEAALEWFEKRAKHAPPSAHSAVSTG
jgi:hypothetical protein